MQDILQPHTSKLEQESATSPKIHLLLVNNITNLTNELLQIKQDIDQLKQELHLMKLKITNNNEEIKNTTQPTLDAMLRDLRQALNTQKDENSKLQLDSTINIGCHLKNGSLRIVGRKLHFFMINNNIEQIIIQLFFLKYQRFLKLLQ